MATATQVQIPVPSEWIATELLERQGLSIEPVVMLEEVNGEPAVRRLSPAEKVAYQRRTGASVGFGSDEEFMAYLEASDEDDGARAQA